MEPVWRLSESVSRDTEFSLTESWSLGGLADDWLFSDFLGAGVLIGRHTGLSGSYSDEQRLSGRYKDEQAIKGRYKDEHKLEGDV